MSRKSNEELVPRNGHTLETFVVCRISGCQNQKELSLEDQQDNARALVSEMYDGEYNMHVISTTGKGESLDRPELAEMERAYCSGKYDLGMNDDLSRIVRGGEAVRLMGLGVDHGTRTICISDGIDTANETWEEDALNACSANVAHNERTSCRVKQKVMNRFKKTGHTAARPIACYFVPEGVSSFDGWEKKPGADDWVKGGAEALNETHCFTAVADDFNAQGIPVSVVCRKSKSWTGAMVRDFYSNPLLKGKAYRGKRKTIKIHGRGRRPSVMNPKGPTFYDCPHLAFFPEQEYDEIQKLITSIGTLFRRKKIDGKDPRQGIPRSRTRFPGQFARCHYCGRTYVWGGNGVTGNLMCSGAREWKCWNSYGIDGAFATSKLVEYIVAELNELKGFDEQYRSLVAFHLQNREPELELRLAALRENERKLETEKTNVAEAIRAFGAKRLTYDLLADLERQETRLKRERDELQVLERKDVRIPESIMVVEDALKQDLTDAVVNSPEFGMLLRKVVVDFRVHLVRSCDGGGVLPRANVKLALDGILPEIRQVTGAAGLLERDLTIDLFEPAQRHRILAEASVLAAGGLGPKAIAASIPQRPSTRDVDRALVLQKRMAELAVDDPYVVLEQPLENFPRMRRHKNPKFRFTPLEGYVAPKL